MKGSGISGGVGDGGDAGSGGRLPAYPELAVGLKRLEAMRKEVAGLCALSL